MSAHPIPSKVAAAYTGVVLIWSTTPLATQWSGAPGYMFGVTSRMCIAFVCVFALLGYRGVRLPVHPRAWAHYGASAISFYGAMCMTYQAAQLIPSGWISVIYGLTPLMTAVLSRIMLGENSLTPRKLGALALSVVGLWIIYGYAAQLGASAVFGIGLLLIGAFLHALSVVSLKRLNVSMPALASVAGTLLVAVPAYLLTWWCVEGTWPADVPLRSVASIVYLGVVATTIGFSLYFYILKSLTATQVALIALLTPVIALGAGYWLNHEPLTPRVVAGTGLILLGLLLHELKPPRRAA